jgi:hypothetical protein
MADRLPSYEDVMFAHEDLNDLTIFFFDNIVAHHEAGHAVVGYALGIGTHCIQMRTQYSPVESTCAPHGCWIPSKRHKAEFRRNVNRWEADPNAFSHQFVLHGIATAAGAAAEYKYCRAEGLAHRALFGTDGDHKYIESTDKELFRRAGRNGYSFQRLVWQKTRKVLEHPNIWKAVCALGYILADEYSPYEDGDATGDYSAFSNMPGSVARSIMHRHGVRKGMALDLL